MILTELFVILALIVVNGVFAGAEIAIVSLRHTRLQQLVDAARVGAKTVAALRAEPERFFATVQVGITVVTTTAAAFGGARMAQPPRAAAAAAARLVGQRRRRGRAGDRGRAGLVPVAGAGRAGAEVARAPPRRALRAAGGQADRGAVADREADRLAADRDLEPGAAAVLGPHQLLRVAHLEGGAGADGRRGGEDRRHPRARQRARVARAGLRSPGAERRDAAARAHRRAADARDDGSDPPLPAGGAPVAHPRLRSFAGRHRRLRQREGHRVAGLGRRAGRARRTCSAA